MFQPVLEESDNTVDMINSYVKGIASETLIITNVIIGTFIFRRRDNTYTSQYEMLVEHGKVTPESRIEY